MKLIDMFFDIVYVYTPLQVLASMSYITLTLYFIIYFLVNLVPAPAVVLPSASGPPQYSTVSRFPAGRDKLFETWLIEAIILLLRVPVDQRNRKLTKTA